MPRHTGMNTQMRCLLTVLTGISTSIAVFAVASSARGAPGSPPPPPPVLGTGAAVSLATPPVTAHVLSMDAGAPRARHTANALAAVGFQVVFVAPSAGGLTIADKVLSNKRAFLDALERHLQGSPAAWLYLFEDDITAHRGIYLPDVQATESRATHFMYLGICGPRVRAEWPLLKSGGRCGRCAHAMGFSRAGAAAFLAFNRNNTDAYTHGMYLDVMVEAWCLSLGGFPVVHFDRAAPHEPGHRGVFYQDRRKFPTGIG